MFIELHLLRHVGPSCLNRDDTNAPKDCLFGGVRRARLSSQCLKRAIRWHPEFTTRAGLVMGVRTKRVAEQVMAALEAPERPAAALAQIVPAIVQPHVGQLTPQHRTRALVHLGEDEIERLIGLVEAHWEELEAARVAEQAAAGGARRRRDGLAQLGQRLAGQLDARTTAGDVALFGRMVAENAHLNLPAACQVAHALSTHRVTMEIDFFSAVDDLKPRESPAADMIGTTEFNSACFYQYCCVSLRQLVANLGGDQALATDILEAFLHAAVAAVPVGRQTAMAAHSPPSFVLAVVRERGASWSLVNAFETPVWVSAHDRRGLVRKSISALDDYWGQLAGMYTEAGIVSRPACWLGEAEVAHLHDQRLQRVDEVIDTALAATGAGGA